MNKVICERKEKAGYEIRELEKRNRKLYNLRLILFIVFIAILSVEVFLDTGWAGYGAVITAAALIYFIVLCVRNDGKIRRADRIYRLCEKLVRRSCDDWKNEEWNDSVYDMECRRNGKHFMGDLNITGDNSLLKYIDLTVTEGGWRRLRDALSGEVTGTDRIRARQEAVREISEKPDFAVDFLAELMNASEGERKNLSECTASFRTEKGGNAWQVVGTAVSAAMILSLGAAFFGSAGAELCVILFFIRLFVSYCCMIANGAEFTGIASSARMLGKLSALCRIAGKEKFESSICSEMSDEMKKASERLEAVTRLADADSLRLNFLTYVILNGVLPFNEYILYRHRRQVELFTAELDACTDAIGKFEELISLAVPAYVRSHVSFPEITDEMIMQVSGMRHPLIWEKECVPNDFSAGKSVNIITGSNMCGKTSFIRTAGICLVMARCGAPVTCDSMICPAAEVFTSINVGDDITGGISTFYGELLRIKEALEYGREGGRIYVLIDEIFRGTNFNDRIYGAEQVIKAFSEMECTAFITTHDPELCDVENPRLVNYYFSESYDHEKIISDHIIRKGRCRSSNGRLLMEKMGLFGKK